MNSGVNFIWLIGGGCCCFLFLLVLGLVAWKLTGRKPQSEDSEPTATLTDGRPVPGAAPAVGRMAQYGNIISEVSNDGFYILNQFLPTGSTVHYRYRSGGSWVARSVPYQPGPRGHYVYLGAMPQDLQVTDVVPPGTGTGAEAPEDPMRTMIIGSGAVAAAAAARPVEKKPPPKPSSFPSAY